MSRGGAPVAMASSLRSLAQNPMLAAETLEKGARAKFCARLARAHCRISLVNHRLRNQKCSHRGDTKWCPLDQTEYAFPCFFLGDPHVAPDPNAPATSQPRHRLGLSGVIDKIRISFEGDPGPGAPHGYLIVEKKVP